MIDGLAIFRTHFADFAGNYMLIGGAACDIQLERVGVPFRVTRDLDIVLCVEALSPEFGRAFWDFVNAGAYQKREKSGGGKQFYRFSRPATPGYPVMLELFSRQPDFAISPESGLTPIPLDDEVSSLSAILLDDGYYDFIREHRVEIGGLPLLAMEALIVLKAKAWLDLSDRRARGEAVDARNIKTHKNDICRLFAALPEIARVRLPSAIEPEIRLFLNRLADSELDPRSLGLPLSREVILNGLGELFELPGQQKK
ncbi:MAG: hypothetical protein AB7F32_08290 [Victivallaceae bacterium]